MSPDRVADAVRTLLALGLLREQEGTRGTHIAIAPDSAEIQLVGPAMRRIAQMQSAMDQIRGEFSELLDTYRSGMLHRLRREGVEIITNLEAVRARLEDLSAGAKKEVLTSQPGGARSAEVLGEAARRTEATLGRGVVMRTLYQHTAQFSQATLAFVERITELGAEVRTLGDAFFRLIVFDREVALIELHDNPRGAALVRDPSVVAFMVDVFERAWAQGRPFPLAVGRREAIAASDAVKADIIRMLIAGADDKVIARRLAVSVRTCQRHINEIMALIGARNRVQAGYLLREAAPYATGRAAPGVTPTCGEEPGPAKPELPEW
ncbi:LuxR C-terminal-related transcriptional regulator (plasmid) [Streptomyces sp. P9-2B-2]|uniref:LuxR C-terminal-related transcriptional regulator n=1 Tax=Streptomyces sp. P9-2B-2 TaxID=3057114 RepID=UPI0025B56BDF|nr:LuxR C-terminal-related transcriptional regulator [Streptomyces sp. P9-2B-2]WJY43275.1 LuxR C-terminal-related transcriptional regulator [Streptomyces sp. P9-2B-2]